MFGMGNLVTLSYLAVATDRACDLDVNKCDGEEVFPPEEGGTGLEQN